MMVECRKCSNDIVVKFQARKLKCPHCGDEIKWIGLIYKAVSKFDKKVYIGQTKTPLRERINGYKCNVTTGFDRRVNKYGQVSPSAIHITSSRMSTAPSIH